MDCASYPAVLKADGLAAGKGVVIAPDPATAKEALRAFFLDERFGEAGRRVVLEEHLEGEELSLLALCDGELVVPMASAQDYKRIRDGDEGPNTGGMGSYSPVGGDVESLVSAVHQPVVDELAARGTPFVGLLFAGVMLTDAGPYVLEFNCRFGDPETQSVLPRLETDLLELLAAAAGGDLSAASVSVEENAAVTVVVAAGEYPEAGDVGTPIEGIDDAQATGALVFHAGTALTGDRIVTNGGRILNVTAVADSVSAARDRAYEACELISFPRMRYRRDIAALAHV
jgi:phosphoribosylamine--glycine ligase